MARKKGVFLVHRSETASGKRHSVHFGRDFNNPKNTKSFKELATAKKFALNKARKIGVKSVLMDLPSGTRDVSVKVPMLNKRAKKVRKRAKRVSAFQLDF